MRLTLFVSLDAGSPLEAVSWASLTGAKPENVQNKAGDEREEGPFLGGRLLLQKQPQRVDLYYAKPVSEENEPEDPVPTLGELESAFETFHGVVSQLLESLHSCCVRIAFGTEFVRPAESLEAAYRTVVEHIGSATFHLEGGQEFLYQINRPRPSRVLKSLVINRLTQWHASSWQPVRFVMGTGNAQTLLGPRRIRSTITTDVNTDAERRVPLPGESLGALVKELQEMTAEIRDKGDIP